MNSTDSIHTKDLSRHFGDIQAVWGIRFDVRQDEIVSLLCPNGAGKSTTIAMLACLLKPSSAV